jgi:cell division control protein 6
VVALSIFSELEDSFVFKREEALSTEYVPKMLPHRGNEIKQIAKNILPASRGRKPQNTFIFGPPGIGKTAVAKNVFREFEEYSDRVRTVYVNCWDFKTPTALLTKVTTDIGFFTQRRGWGKDEVISRLIESLNKTNKGLIVALDEVDQMKKDALYDLLRLNQYVKNPIGIIFISNYQHVFADVEPRIRSSLAIEEQEFKPYTIVEMKDILTSRAHDAFRSFEPAAVMLCANQAVQKGGDVRVGLQCLLKAGREAERDEVKKLKVKHVKAIMKHVKEAKPQVLKKKVSEHEKLLLNVLSVTKRMTAGELYNKYSELAEKKGHKPVSDRAVRDFINHLADTGLIEITEKKVGKSRLIRITKTWKKK